MTDPAKRSTPAVLDVSPDPVPAFSDPTVTGRGFSSREEVLVGIPGDLRFKRLTPSSTGTFSFVYEARSLYPGYSYTMEAWVNVRKGKWELQAARTFSVQ